MKKNVIGNTKWAIARASEDVSSAIFIDIKTVIDNIHTRTDAIIAEGRKPKETQDFVLKAIMASSFSDVSDVPTIIAERTLPKKKPGEFLGTSTDDCAYSELFDPIRSIRIHKLDPISASAIQPKRSNTSTALHRAWRNISRAVSLDVSDILKTSPSRGNHVDSMGGTNYPYLRYGPGD